MYGCFALFIVICYTRTKQIKKIQHENRLLSCRLYCYQTCDGKLLELWNSAVYFESLRVPGLGFEDLMRYMRGVMKGKLGV